MFTDITGENYAHSCAFIRLIAGDRRGSIRFRSWPRFRLCHTGEFAGGVEFRRRNVRAECYVRLAAHGADDGELRLHAPPSVFIDRPRTRAARIVADDHDVGRRRVPNQFGVAFSSSAECDWKPLRKHGFGRSGGAGAPGQFRECFAACVWRRA